MLANHYDSFEIVPFETLDGQLCWLNASRHFVTPEEAAQYVATLPKALNVKASFYTDFDNVTRGLASFHVRLKADKANGGVNESGLKRLRRFVATVPVSEIPPSVAPLLS